MTTGRTTRELEAASRAVRAALGVANHEAIAVGAFRTLRQNCAAPVVLEVARVMCARQGQPLPQQHEAILECGRMLTGGGLTAPADGDDVRNENGLTPTESQRWRTDYTAIASLMTQAVVDAPTVNEARRRVALFRLELRTLEEVLAHHAPHPAPHTTHEAPSPCQSNPPKNPT